MHPPSPPLRLVRAWLPALVWMAIIFLASTDAMSAGHTSRFLEPLLRWLIPGISPAHLDLGHYLIRKAAHVTEYAILAAFLCRALRQTSVPAISWGKILPATIIVAAFYAAGDEYHQSFVQSRTASSHDVLFDVAGAILGTVLFYSLQKRK